MKQMEMKNTMEKVLWATKKGEQSWMEQVITSTTSEAHLEKAKQWALSNGFDRLRVSILDMSQKPDFSKVIN